MEKLEKINKSIKRNKIILANLKDNMANKTPGDSYPYEADIAKVEKKILELELEKDLLEINPPQD
jgi:hypothetical protein